MTTTPIPPALPPNVPPSLRLTVGALKGGSGKTTTAVYLALGIARATGARVLLVDADPQAATASDWAGSVNARHWHDPDTYPAWPDAVVVVPWHGDDLGRRIAQVADDYTHVIIDTGGESDRILAAALWVTDELLVPVQPNPADVRRLPATFGVAANVHNARPGRPLTARVLLTRVSQRTVLYREATDLLERQQLPVMSAEVRLSLGAEGYAAAFGTVPHDLADYATVLAELADSADDEQPEAVAR